MSNGQQPFPPGMPPGLPTRAALVGGPQPPGPAMAMEATIMPRDKVQNALYHAAAVLSNVKAELLQCIATLSETQLACKQTLRTMETQQGTLSINGERMSAEEFQRKFEMARQEDADAVAKAINYLQEAVDNLGVDEMVQISDRDQRVAP